MASAVHRITVDHERDTIGSWPTMDSTTTVSATAATTDLVETWCEVLSRMPPDLYMALKAAMGKE